MSIINLEVEMISQLCNDQNFHFKPRKSFKDEWNKILQSSEYSPYLYSNSSIKYQTEYRVDKCTKAFDISTIVYYRNEAVALLPLAIAFDGENYKLISQTNFNGLEEPPPVNRPLMKKDIPLKNIKKINNECLKLINKIALKLNIKAWQSADYFDGKFQLSEWHLSSMNFGAKCSIIHELYIDLSLDIKVIKRHFRKSYKSLLDPSKNNINVFIMEKEDLHTWNEFKELHFKLAGRKTRSDNSWQYQLDEINNSESILIYLRNSKDDFLGGGFFNLSKDEGVYAVAAYRRDMKNLPLGHIIQYKAIKELKNRGLKWYRIGHLPFQGDEVMPSLKYLDIGSFKKGFATNIVPKFIFTYQTTS